MRRFYTAIMGIFAVFIITASTVNAGQGLTASNIMVYEEDPYLPFAEVMPEPVGGLEEIYKKVTYPEVAKRLGIEGKVYVLIYVNESGSVDDVKVIKGIGGGCDEAAVNAIKGLKFNPGKNAGSAVKVKMSLSVVFKMK